MTTLQQLMQNNAEWADRVQREDPTFFDRLSKQQRPEFLWIGCSDSRVPANQILGLDPGEVFVHRNVANLIIHTDLNALSTIQFAVDLLKVKHILVVGHYGCNGIQASLHGTRVGLADNWLRHVSDVGQKHAAILARAKNDHDRQLRLCELNVIEQVVNVCETTVVQDAWARGQELMVHGWVYSLSDGRLRALSVDIKSSDAIPDAYQNGINQVIEKIQHTT